MNLQTILKSFYLILLFAFLVCLIVILTYYYFDYNYSISPTFDLLRWTGFNIILLHILYLLIIIYRIFKNKQKINLLYNSLFTTLLIIVISLILTVLYFYDFINYIQ